MNNLSAAMKRYDTILFDLDGTITDSKFGVQRCVRLALDGRNIPYTQAILDKMIGPPFRVSMKEFFGLEDSLVEELIAVYREEYEIKGWTECTIYDGVVELLKRLKDAGFRLAVATLKPIKFTNLIIDGLHLRQYFEYVGGASSDSSRDNKADVINHVFDGLHNVDKSRCVMLGDRMYDIDGAKECGIDSIAILWGYGDKEEFLEHNATYILDTPENVFNFLTK